MSELKSHDLVDIQDYRGEVYIKSEADKVIAHQKYRRCLAMAKMCSAHKLLWEGYVRDWWQKWHKRWLELAEKFKEEI